MKYELSEKEYIEALSLVKHVFSEALQALDRQEARQERREEREAEERREEREARKGIRVSKAEPELESWPAWPDEESESDVQPELRTDPRPEASFETKFDDEPGVQYGPVQYDLDGKPVNPEAAAFGAERFDKGASAFGAFVDAWIDGLTHDDKAVPLSDVEQPDRGALIRDLANGPNVLNVLAYVGKCGGLTHAIDSMLPASALYHLNESERRAFVKAVSTVICATSSLLFPELSDHYEHRDIYKGKP
jgi:hypothetical protein